MGDLVKFAETTSIGGLAQIVENKNWARRIYWIVVVVSSWVYAGYLTREAILDWEENPVLTTTDTGRISDVQFPKIVVCPPRVNIQLHFSC